MLMYAHKNIPLDLKLPEREAWDLVPEWEARDLAPEREAWELVLGLFFKYIKRLLWRETRELGTALTLVGSTLLCSVMIIVSSSSRPRVRRSLDTTLSRMNLPHTPMPTKAMAEFALSACF